MRSVNTSFLENSILKRLVQFFNYSVLLRIIRISRDNFLPKTHVAVLLKMEARSLMNFPQKLFMLLQILLNCQIESMTSTPNE